MKVVSYSLGNMEKELWACLEDEAQHLSAFQTYSWAEALNSVGTEPRFVIAIDNKKPLLGLALFRSSLISKTFSGYEAIGPLLCVSHIDASAICHFFSALKRILKGASALYFYWNPFPYLNLDDVVLSQGFLPIPSATFVVDLSPSIESLWKNLEGRARRSISRAERKGIEVVESEKWREWKEFYDLYVRVCHSKSMRPRSIDLHKSVYNYLATKGKARLFLAKYRGEIVGGIIFLVTPHEMMGYEGVSDVRFLKLSSNSAVHWHAISWAKDHGIKNYDFGGALWKLDKKHYLYGIQLFKRQWGGKLRKYNSYALNKLYFIGRTLPLRSSKIRRLYYAMENLRVIKRSDRI